MKGNDALKYPSLQLEINYLLLPIMNSVQFLINMLASHSLVFGNKPIIVYHIILKITQN